MRNYQDRTDAEIKTDVLVELKYEPSVKATDVGVLVKDGTVTLNGDVPSHFEKSDAVRAAKRVAGVRAIVDKIDVVPPDPLRRSDEEIAAAVAHHIGWSSAIPPDSVKATVREGWITLEGQVDWWYQRDAAEKVVEHLTGVKAVSNLIAIKPRPTSAGVETAITSAFERNAVVDAGRIHVETSGGTVTLRGTVRNHAEREEAERVAWAANGVLSVDNQLSVRLS